MGSRHAGQPAPYGQACIQCFKAKCKCILREDGEACQRCHRLGRQCTPSNAARRRNAYKANESSRNIAKLEERIDGLVSLLKSVTKSPENLAALHQAVGNGHSTNSNSTLSIGRDVEDLDQVNTDTPQDGSPLSEISSGGKSEENQLTSQSKTSAASSQACNDDTHDGDTVLNPTDVELQDCIELFRTKMLPFCPFVYLPPDVSIAVMKRKQPFLLQAIAAVATPSTQIRLARGRELKRILSQEMVIENRSSIDLLLALLTFIAWSYDHFLSMPGKKGVSRLATLAMSVVYELRLHKPYEEGGNCLATYPGSWISCDPQQDDKAENREPDDSMLEQYRAVLGCFLLSSCVSCYFNRIEPLPWTPHLEDCLRAIEARKTNSSDVTFALQVRIQLVAHKLRETRDQKELHPATITLFLEALREQVRGLTTSIPTRLAQGDLLRVHGRFVELCISDVARTHQPPEPASTVPSLNGRPDHLWQSLTAIKSCFDIFLSMTPSAWIGFSLLVTVQMAQCLAMLFTFSMLDDPAWDCQIARNLCDLVVVVDGIYDLATRASIEAGETADDDLFRSMCHKMLELRERFITSMSYRKHPESENNQVVDDHAVELETNRISFPNTTASLPAYRFFGTGEWMEQIFGGSF